MDRYDSDHAPDPNVWLDLDEGVRIDLVRDYHTDAEIEIPAEGAHASIHVVVENQVALGEEPVPETIERLMRQGLDRHEAIHAVGAVLLEDIHNLVHAKQEKFDLRRYRSRLDKLTAKRWRKGQY
jgi:uncharacterized protein YoaH (UPF0181 family)